MLENGLVKKITPSSAKKKRKKYQKNRKKIFSFFHCSVASILSFTKQWVKRFCLRFWPFDNKRCTFWKVYSQHWRQRLFYRSNKGSTLLRAKRNTFYIHRSFFFVKTHNGSQKIQFTEGKLKEKEKKLVSSVASHCSATEKRKKKVPIFFSAKTKKEWTSLVFVGQVKWRRWRSPCSEKKRKKDKLPSGS